jgi:N12 class adenine-specific DNA methylase
MKARYLDEQHAGHGVTFATGTPISNTMVEMFTLCSAEHNVYYVAKRVMWRPINSCDPWPSSRK